MTAVPLCSLIFGCLALLHPTISVAENRADSKRNPVLLIHGIKDTGRKMERMARYLQERGWDVETITLRPSWGQLGLDELAQQIAAHTDAKFARGQKFDIVAFSMGGLAARFYLQRLGGLERVEHFITLATPHHGTWMAYTLPNKGGRQMRPRSAFLRDLASDEARLSQVKFISIWTPLDLIILPPRSSEIASARNAKMWIALHPLMVWQPGPLRAVAAALRE